MAAITDVGEAGGLITARRLAREGREVAAEGLSQV